MNLKLKRVDPFWMIHPMILTGIAVGAVLTAVGFRLESVAVEVLGAIVVAVSIFLATKPAVSAVLGSMGVIIGLASFFLSFNASSLGMSAPLKIVSTAVFALTYMVLMDAAVLVLAALYNFFASVGGFGGVSVEFEEAQEG